MNLQKNRREWTPYHRRRRDGREENRDGFAAILRPVPVTQIYDDAGNKPGFGNPQKETQPVELLFAADQAGERCHYAPGDHDARDPFARTPYFRQDRAGDFEQKIADEENAAPQAEYVIREAQLPGHLQTGEAYVDAIQVGNDE